jgi:hypothetical protein
VYYLFHVLSYVLGLLGSLWIIVLAWLDGILWGLACLLFPPVQLIYIGMNWKKTKQGFFLMIAERWRTSSAVCSRLKTGLRVIRNRGRT